MKILEGYASLRRGLGGFLARKRRLEGYSQAELACELGINRVSLSRIERGRSVPSYNTLYELMGILDFDWDEIADKGVSSKAKRKRLSLQLQGLGEALRLGRRDEGLTLHDLSTKVGVSVSQLSKLEHGQISYGKCIRISYINERPRDDLFCPEHDEDWRIYEFSHPELVRLSVLGGYESPLS